MVLGLGMEPQGLTRDAVTRTIGALNAAADVVAFTIAEYFPRQVLALQDLLGKIEFPARRKLKQGASPATGAG